MFSVPLMVCWFGSFSLPLSYKSRDYGIFDSSLIFDSESSLCPLHCLQVCRSSSETPCIFNSCINLHYLFDLNLNPKPLILPLDSTKNMDFHIRTVFTQVLCKKVHDTSILRTIALEKINTLYPEPDCIHLYTDGSLVNDIDIEGSGECSNLFSFYSQIEKSRTAFDDEIVPIRMSLIQLLCHLKSFTRTVIFCERRFSL